MASWAEVYNGDTDAEQAIIVDIIHDELAPRLIGRSATDPEGAWPAMEPSTNDILRDRGLALQAIACLDTAIWDVLARAVGLPLHRLWGSVTDSLPMSVIGGYYHLDAGETQRVVADYAERFSGMKFKVGGRSPAEDAERVRLAREAAGPDFVDHGRCQPGLRVAPRPSTSRVAPSTSIIRWFEEPCRWINDRRWMRDVRNQTGLPVAAGQSEVTLGGLRDLIVEGAIDVSNFDASWAGGPTVWRRAAGLCAAFGDRDRSPRGAAGGRRTCSPPCRGTRSWSASTRSATRSSGNLSDLSTFLERRPPAAARSAGLRHRVR